MLSAPVREVVVRYLLSVPSEKAVMAASRGYVITSSSPPRHEVSVATDVSMRATDSNVAFISLFLLGCIGFPLTDHAIADGD